MAIYLGQTQLTGLTNVTLGSTAQTVYLGSTLIYPQNVTHTLSAASVSYSSGSQIDAAGSNYATITANVYTYVNGTYYSSAASQTLTVHNLSGSGFTSSAGTYILAENRSNVIGNRRSATCYATYDNITAGTFTIYQQANNRTYTTTTIGLTADTNFNFTALGGDLPIECEWEYDYSYSYTSGYQTSGSSTDIVTATSYYGVDSYNWISTGITDDEKVLVVLRNYYGYSRSATITAAYKPPTEINEVTANSTTFTQYRAPYDTYQYEITSVSIPSDTWSANQAGLSYARTITANCRYNQSRWQDGVLYPGTWQDYTGQSSISAPEAEVSNSDFYLQEIGTGYSGLTEGELYYNNTKDGTIRIYPSTINTSGSQRETDVDILFGNVWETITVYQNP